MILVWRAVNQVSVSDPYNGEALLAVFLVKVGCLLYPKSRNEGGIPK